MTPSRLRAIELAIPLAETFANAVAVVRDRRVVLVGVADDEGNMGWGEAAPFPGATNDDVDQVWESLATGHIGSFSPSAMAAYQEARFDGEARAAGVPLWRLLGGQRRSAPASLAIGLSEDVDEALSRAAAAHAAGYGMVKIKLTPDRLPVIAAIRQALPDLGLGVDGNGSFVPGERDLLVSLEQWDVRYLEQPFVVGALAATAELRRRLDLAVVLDEDIISDAAAATVVEVGAADVVTVKLARLGIDGALAVSDIATAAGVRVKVSGLLETGIGRGHALALAMRHDVVFSDLAPAQAFLVEDIVDRPWTMSNGRLEVRDTPGIGVDPDPAMLERYRVRESTVALSGDR